MNLPIRLAISAAIYLCCITWSTKSPRVALAAQSEDFWIAKPASDELIDEDVTVEIGTAASLQIKQLTIYVNGKILAVLHRPPWKTTLHAGDDLSPRQFKAIAVCEDGSIREAVLQTKGYSFHYREDVELVILNVTVFDENDLLVKDLKQDQFTVLEDGRRREIVDFSQESLPLNIVILLDTSGSMMMKMGHARRAAQFFAQQLSPEDQTAIVGFSDEIIVWQDFTNDHRMLTEALNRPFAGGPTPLYDALNRANSMLQDKNGKKVIVLLSDGHDYGSETKYQTVLKRIQKTETIVYIIGLFGDGLTPGLLNPESRMKSAEELIKLLAERTGGGVYLPKSVIVLEEIYQKIARTLKNQYVITYRPNRLFDDGRWRTIKVEMANPQMRAVTRKGYFAPYRVDQ